MHKRCTTRSRLAREVEQLIRPPSVSRRRQSTATVSSHPPKARVDPFTSLAPHLSQLRTSLVSMLGSAHPAISEITKYYFLHPSKQVRPLIVLLLAQATNGLGGDWEKKRWEAECAGAGGKAEELDMPISRPDVLNDWNPSMPPGMTALFDSKFVLNPAKPHREHRPVPPSHFASSSSPSSPTLSGQILPAQKRLAQIVEMMHTASLLHDDVIDASALRRGAPSAPSAFGNKLSVLGGNFVLGRASAALARLGDGEVTELIASVLSNLVEGEILQLKEIKMDAEGKEKDGGSSSDSKESSSSGKQKSQDAWNLYLQKTYLKTASLMAKGARSAVVLGGCRDGEVWKEIAYAYGRNLGIAFQLVDDVLDYESASATLGKPGNADLQLGLATGPALYAWEEFPEIGDLIQRKFDKPGDVELARDYVLRSSGVLRTRALAQAYADKAKEVLQALPDSEAKEGLEVLAERVIGRKS